MTSRDRGPILPGPSPAQRRCAFEPDIPALSNRGGVPSRSARDQSWELADARSKEGKQEITS